MHFHNLLHGLAIREGNVVEEATTQEGVRQLFLVIGGNDDDRALLGLDGLIGLVNVELHLVEFLQQVVRELDVGLVDFIDQQNGTLFGLERFPELAFLDVVGNVMHLVDAQLGITQTTYRVILVQPLMRLGGGFDVPGNQLGAHGLGQLLGQHGFTRARLALDQQRAFQGNGSVNRQFEVVGCDVGLSTFELHLSVPWAGARCNRDQALHEKWIKHYSLRRFSL